MEYLERLKNYIECLKDYIKYFRNSIRYLKNPIQHPKSFFELVKNSLGHLKNYIEDTGEYIEDPRDSTEDISNPIKDSGDFAEDFENFIKNQLAKIKDQEAEIKDLKTKIEDIKNKSRDLDNGKKYSKEFLEDLGISIKDSEDFTEDFKNSTEYQLGEIFDRKKITKEARDKTRNLESEKNDIEKFFKDLKGFFEGSKSFSELSTKYVNELSFSKIERLASVDPSRIGVTQDPPLCWACNEALSKPQKLGELTYIAYGIDRLRISAELGCYMCSIMYNGSWTAQFEQELGLPPTQNLSSMSSPPVLFQYQIDQAKSEYDRQNNCFQVNAHATSHRKPKRLWKLSSVVLIPEQRIERKMLYTVDNANSPDIIAQEALSWIKECHSTHLKCQLVAASTTWKPTRLIHTGRPDLGIMPRLCISSELPPEITYVTLSHCWGLAEIFRLVSANLANLLEKLPLPKLTQVFRDAIDLARRLGISYIWIDSLCIIQDSIQDWEHESVLMRDVYRHSWCNIAATGFKNGLQGMYVKRNPSSLMPIMVNMELEVPDEGSWTKVCRGRFYCMEKYWHTDVTKAPLNQRAWVTQERILSPRILHMGSRQAFWECSELEACEIFPSGLPIMLESHFKNKMVDLLSQPQPARFPLDVSVGSVSNVNPLSSEKAMIELWWTIVGAYNHGGLTKQEDKLIAIAGIAKEMQIHLNDEYVAGLWRKHLLQQLCWAVLGDENEDVLTWSRNPRPQIYQAPSWSWASVNERIQYIIPINSPTLATVINCKVTLGGVSEFGRVTDGFVRIRGRLTQAKFQANDQTLHSNWFRSQTLKLRKDLEYSLVTPFLLPDIRVHVPEDTSDFPFQNPVQDAMSSQNFHLLPLCGDGTELFGLILQHTQTGIQGQYRRLGLFFFTEKEKSLQTFKSHIPFLEPEDYEEYDGCESTITII